MQGCKESRLSDVGEPKGPEVLRKERKKQEAAENGLFHKYSYPSKGQPVNRVRQRKWPEYEMSVHERCLDPIEEAIRKDHDRNDHGNESQSHLAWFQTGKFYKRLWSKKPYRNGETSEYEITVHSILNRLRVARLEDEQSHRRDIERVKRIVIEQRCRSQEYGLLWSEVRVHISNIVRPNSICPALRLTFRQTAVVFGDQDLTSLQLSL